MYLHTLFGILANHWLMSDSLTKGQRR